MDQEGIVRDDLILSSKKIPNWIGDDCSNYEGFWYREDRWQAVLSCRKHFQIRNSDIFLASLPKSGTTWVKAMMYAIVNPDRNPIGSEDHPLLTNNPHVTVPCLEMQLYAKNAIPDLTNMPAPRLFATHSPSLSLNEKVMSSSCKIIYICRNPKDCFISLWHFLDKLRPAEVAAICISDAFDRFCKGESVFGPYWDHVLVHWKASLEMPEKVMFLTYERVMEQPNHYLKEIAEFMGCPFSALEESKGVVDGIVKLCSFGHLSQLEVNKSGIDEIGIERKTYFRRGEIGDSKNYLSLEMMNKIDKITQDKFSQHGLKIYMS